MSTYGKFINYIVDIHYGRGHLLKATFTSFGSGARVVRNHASRALSCVVACIADVAIWATRSASGTASQTETPATYATGSARPSVDHTFRARL